MISMGESVGLGDHHHHHHHQVSEKLLQTASPEMDSDPVPPNEPHSDSSGEVGGTDKRPHVVSIGEYLGLHDSKLKDVKRVLQDDVVDYLENIFGYGHNKETLDTLKNVTGDCGNHLHGVVRAKHAKRKRDSDGEVGGSWKRPRLGSIGVEHMLPDFKFKDVKSEASLTASDVGTPSADESPKSSEASLITDDIHGTLSADESLDDSEMEYIHDSVVNYLKSGSGYGHYQEILDTFRNGKGELVDHLRAVVRAKEAKRKRDSKGLCSSAYLAGLGLTDNDITNLRRYFREHLAKLPNAKDWSRELKKKGAYGAYLRALIRTEGGSFDEILEAMIKVEGVPLKALAVVATETSSWEVRQLNIFLRGGRKRKGKGKGKGKRKVSHNSGLEPS